MNERKLHEGYTLSADYIREHFTLTNSNDFLGIEHYVSKDKKFCCNVYRDDTVSELERYE